MSFLDEIQIIDKLLVREYGPEILQIREKYCYHMVVDNDQATVANYVLTADRERFREEGTALNCGHVLSGLTYSKSLWDEFMTWAKEEGGLSI